MKEVWMDPDGDLCIATRFYLPSGPFVFLDWGPLVPIGEIFKIQQLKDAGYVRLAPL